MSKLPIQSEYTKLILWDSNRDREMNESFQKFLLLFHQDILSTHNRFENAVHEAAGGLSADEKKALIKYLKEVEDDKDIRFVDIWNQSQSPFGISSEPEARKILRQILEAL